MLVVAAAACSFWSAGISQTGDPGGPTVRITEYDVPTTYGNPHSITSGPDGAIWFTELDRHKIGRISTDGLITEYPNVGHDGIATGPDGALWFTDLYGNSIGRLSIDGEVAHYPVPTPGGGPFSITRGPDGALWFTEILVYKIGRITTAGVFTEYDLPAGGRQSLGICAGPDGALWYTREPNRVGRITTSGAVTEFTLPSAYTSPRSITTGPDGALWFTESFTNRIGRITTGGAVTEYDTHMAGSPWAIVKGMDGALWFTTYWGSTLGRVSTTGRFTEYTMPTPTSWTAGIALGSDDALWVAEQDGNKIARVDLQQGTLQNGAGGIRRVQYDAIEGSSAASLSAGFPWANTAGNLILAAVRMSTTGQTVTISDSAGNAYRAAVSQAHETDPHEIHVFYAANVAGGANTVTAAFSSPNEHPWLAIYEFSGLSTTSPLDRTAHAQGFGSVPSSGPTAATTTATELVFAMAGLQSPFYGTAAPGSEYALQLQDTGSSHAATEAAIVTSQGSYTGSFTLSEPTYWTAVVATFKAVPSDTPGIVEENDPSITYTGTWHAVSGPFHGGGALLANEEGASATIRFTGSGIDWAGLSAEWGGVAVVAIDGVVQGPVDTYRTPAATQVLEYSVGGLSAGPHVLTIVVTGRRNPASEGSWVCIDAFAVPP